MPREISVRLCNIFDLPRGTSNAFRQAMFDSSFAKVAIQHFDHALNGAPMTELMDVVDTQLMAGTNF